MKTTGIHAQVTVRVELDPGEWLLDEDTAVVRIEAIHWGRQGWTDHPHIWTVGRKKDGAWSKSERNDYASHVLPSAAQKALEQVAHLVGHTLLDQATPEEWADQTDLRSGYFPR
jgi:hypothetical protein